MKKWFTIKSTFWKMIKISTAQILMAMICGVSVAHDNYAQPLDRKITIDLKEVSLQQALKEIGQLANVNFIYSEEHLEINVKVSIKAERQTLRQVLEELLTPHQINYSSHDEQGMITLKHKHQDKRTSSTNSSDDRAPLTIITGTVTDAAHTPLAGVNVIIKGTTSGTSTDSEGKYSLSAEDGVVLVFSFIGHKSIEVKVDSRTVIDIVMEEEAASLNEVVVNAGYWQVKEKENTGNIVKVEAKDIEKQPVQNPLAALQGRVAGLDITQATGVPGGNFKVRIRGTNSIANGNDPLFIIDGVPYTSTAMTFNETSAGILGNSLNPLGGTSPLNSINPADIESIEVLKDADATAIYGSRGSNGVILITTKKGKAGKTKVDVNFYTGAGQVARKMNLLNSPQYLAMRNEAFANDNVVPTTANARDLLTWDTTRHTNWQKELIGKASNITDAQVSLSGGESNTVFSAGMGYHRETTVFPGTNSDQRITARTTISNTGFNQKLKTTLSVNYSANNSSLLGQDLTSTAIFLPPNAPALHDQNGNLNWNGWDAGGSLANPLAFLQRKYEAATNRLTASLVTGYSILPNLEVKSRLGYTSTSMDATNLTPISSLSPSAAATALNTTNFSQSDFKNWMVEPQAIWKPKLGKGQFNVLVGTQFLNQTTDGLAQTATGFSSEALMKNIAAAPNRTTGTNYYTQYRYQAVFGRINYAYNGKYIVNLTGRRDGSSRFGPGKQFANFGAIGAAWLFSEEGFIKNALSFLSFGKLRGSFGITGNDQLTDYQYLDAYTSSQGAYQGTIGLTPVRLANPNFAWETNKKLEAGLELAFIDGRISTSVSVYRNRSSNQLVGYPLAPTAGFTSIQANFPATVQNSGVEIELNTVNIQHTDFTWKSSLNFSIPVNKLVAFPNLESSSYAQQYVVGQSLNIRKLYQSTGVNPTTGLYQFKDVNNDGSYDYNDQQTIKYIGQYFFGGLQNSFSYKGFQLDFLFQFSKQQGRNYIYYTGTPGYLGNQPTDVLNSQWHNGDSNASLQKYSQSSDASIAYQRLQSSDRSVSDASYIRLKNLSFSYSLPSAWTKNVRINNARIFVQGQNLLTFTNYKGLDPETQGNFLPPLRVFTAGFSLSF